MRGYPSFLNTKADVQFVVENFPPERWVPDLRRLIDDRYAWYPTGPAAEDSIEDDTHRIDEIDGERWLYELRENPDARYRQLGVGLDELEAWIRGAEA